MRGNETTSEGLGPEAEQPADEVEHRPARWRPRWVLYAVAIMVLALVATYVVSRNWNSEDSGDDPVVVETSAPADTDGDGITDAVEVAGWST